MADNNSLKLRIIAPDRIFYEGSVDMVEMNTTEGEIGVLPRHIPLTVIAKPGILRLYEGEEVKTAALHAGFAEVLPDGVTILAEIIEWPHEIDAARAKAAMQRAEERLHNKTPETDIARAQTALMRAMVRIKALK